VVGAVSFWLVSLRIIPLLLGLDIIYIAWGGVGSCVVIITPDFFFIFPLSSSGGLGWEEALYS
jgi:hypothetical protein